jgi:hypothetical protein
MVCHLEHGYRQWNAKACLIGQAIVVMQRGTEYRRRALSNQQLERVIEVRGQIAADLVNEIDALCVQPQPAHMVAHLNTEQLMVQARIDTDENDCTCH